MKKLKGCWWKGYVRCGRGKYEENEGRLVEEAALDVEEVNMKKFKGGWWRRVC